MHGEALIRWRGSRLLRSTIALVLAAGVAGGCDSTVLPSVDRAPSADTAAPTVSAAPTTPTTEPSATTSPSPSSPGPTGSPSPTPRPVPAHWEEIATPPNLGYWVHAVALAGGKVLAVGERRAATWNPKTGRWRAVDSLNKWRRDAGLIALADGRALLVGGTNDALLSYSSAYLFEPSTGSWAKTGLMHTARSRPAIVELADGRVLVAGGFYGHQPHHGDRSTGVVLAMAHPDGGVATPAPDDADPGNLGRALASAEIYDPATGTWSTTGSMRFARYGAAATRLADGRVLIVSTSSGYSSGIGVARGAIATAELYDPDTGRFTLTGSLPGIDAKRIARQGAPGWVEDTVPGDADEFHDAGTLIALADGDAILVGAADWGHVSRFARSLRYDARRGSWSEVGDTWVSIEQPKPPWTVWQSSTPDVGTAAVAPLPDGRVLAAGVGGGRDVVAFNPRTDRWRASVPRLPAKLGPGAALAVALGDGSVLVLADHRHTSYRFIPRS